MGRWTAAPALLVALAGHAYGDDTAARRAEEAATRAEAAAARAEAAAARMERAVEGLERTVDRAARREETRHRVRRR